MKGARPRRSGSLRRWTRLAGACGLVLLLAAGCRGQESGLDDAGLRVMIDSLLPEIARASGLEVREPVRFSVQSRADVRAFIEAQLRDELGPEELAGMERAYKAFGLLPDTLDLRRLLLDLYTEQVIGYYDPKTRRLYVVEGVTRRDAEPVVAHELVHALQDQWTNLDSLVHRSRGNDRQTAAQAAAEGQATIVMVALEMARSAGRTIDIGALPDLGPLLRPALESENAFPVFEQAPRLIRETMLFPYFAGATFVQALFRAAGPDAPPPVPFGDLLPQSTEQVLDPEARFILQRDVPTELELSEPVAGWRIAYGNVLGQLEVSILLSEHLGRGAAGAAAGWDGDRYALLEGPAGEEALLWYSVWDDHVSAERFARHYRQLLEARPARHGAVEVDELGGRPVVRVHEASRALELQDVPRLELRRLVTRP